MAVLHGFRPALPMSAIQWTNRYAQRVILLVASHAAPQFQPAATMAGARSKGAGRSEAGYRAPARPRRASALHGAAALPALWRRPDGQRRRHGNAREASPWFEPDDDTVTWSSLYAAALAAGAPDTPVSA